MLRVLFFHALIQGATAAISSKTQVISPRLKIDEAKPIFESDLEKILVMTTASVPWLTGTSVNALMRCAELVRTGHDVVLFIPWANPEDQDKIYHKRFETRKEQADYVRRWCAKRNLDCPQIAFYDSRYHAPHHSLYPMGETLELVEDDKLVVYPSNVKGWKPDLIVLEEPEHLNWYAYRRDKGWRDLCPVVGVVHTNYAGYAKTEELPGRLGSLVHPVVGPVKGAITLAMARWMCQAHCHKIIKLSGTIPKLSQSESVCNVHGVRPDFFRVGSAISSPYLVKPATSGAYFIGKMMWQKGLDRLVELLTFARDEYGVTAHVDLVGSGPDLSAVKEKFEEEGLPATFYGRRDHAECAHDYRVLVNPSVTEVLCTTVAEALAMGKWVVVARHVSNEFFSQFPTCLSFSTPDEFAKCLNVALHNEPPPLSKELKQKLTWKAATRRFWDQLPNNDRLTTKQKLAAFFHINVGRGLLGDVVRTVAGAGPKLGFQSRYVAKQKKLVV